MQFSNVDLPALFLQAIIMFNDTYYLLRQEATYETFNESFRFFR